MRLFLLTILTVAVFSAQTVMAETVILNGRTATYKDIVAIADGSKVSINKKALKRVNRSFETLIKAAEEGHMIYGLTTGVGMNKDRKMVDLSGKLTPAVIDASKTFNKGLIKAHCGGVGDPLDVKTTRAVMAVRLNNMLYGGSGVQEDIVLLLRDMLNNNITPILPSNGSIGMADITILGHLGLAMIGDGKVVYQGKIMPADTALKAAGLKPVVLFGKDALATLSSNAFSSAIALLAMADLEQLIDISKLLFAISLEGLNGNVVPFSVEATKLRPYKYFITVSEDLREILKGSYLWNNNDERSLQDPLCYRDTPYFIAALAQSFDELNTALTIQLNSSDDNPGVLISGASKGKRDAESKIQVSSGGAVVPTANFDPVIWVLALEKMSIALGANSNISTQRTVDIGNDYFTKLVRWLSTENAVYGFGAMQKPIATLNAENLFLSNPAMLHNVSLAGNIEDISTNAPLVANKVQKQIDNLFQIYGIEMIHAAQAIDLRIKMKKDGFFMSPTTEKMFKEFRKKVKFLDVDRPLTDDFQSAYIFLKTYK